MKMKKKKINTFFCAASCWVLYSCMMWSNCSSVRVLLVCVALGLVLLFFADLSDARKILVV